VQDVTNAEAAAALPAVRGSDTQAKIANAMNAGLLDSPVLKGLSKALMFKGIGLDPLRAKAAEGVMAYKGKAMAELLANPKLAADALSSTAYTQSLPVSALRKLQTAARAAPVALIGASGDR
jgi:hypothetical protein